MLQCAWFSADHKRANSNKSIDYRQGFCWFLLSQWTRCSCLSKPHISSTLCELWELWYFWCFWLNPWAAELWLHNSHGSVEPGLASRKSLIYPKSHCFLNFESRLLDWSERWVPWRYRTVRSKVLLALYAGETAAFQSVIWWYCDSHIVALVPWQLQTQPCLWISISTPSASPIFYNSNGFVEFCVVVFFFLNGSVTLNCFHRV